MKGNKSWAGSICGCLRSRCVVVLVLLGVYAEPLRAGDVFPDRETVADVYFSWFGGGSGQGTETDEIVRERREVREERVRVVDSEQVVVGGGGGGLEEEEKEPLRVEEREVVRFETRTHVVIVRESEFTEVPVGLFDNDAPGGGLGLNRYMNGWGGGIDYALLSGHDPIHSVNLNAIHRWPIEFGREDRRLGIAPYLIAGGGVQIGDETWPTVHAGGGIEIRMNERAGLFVDARWMVHDSDENWVALRTGIRISFGKGANGESPVLTTPEARPRSDVRGAEIWAVVDPLAKPGVGRKTR